MTLEDHAGFILKSAGGALKRHTMPSTRKAILDSVQAVMDAGYAAGWAAYGDLMIEQLGPDGMVWRPIETAPHGSIVLLGWEDCRDGSWITETGAASTGQRYANGFSSVSHHGSATHWMPLPKPPMTSARKEGP